MGIIHCNLRVLMAERSLNIQKVKDNTSLSRTTISNLYNNYGSGIQFDTLLELCEFLNCTPGDLLSYIQIEPTFNIETESPVLDIEERFHIIDEEGNGFEYVSDISTNLEVKCNLKYEGDSFKFKFSTELGFSIDEDKNIYNVYIDINPEFLEDIKRILIPHAFDYFSDKLSDFFIDWGFNYFYGKEVEGLSNISIHLNFYNSTKPNNN